MVAKNSHQTVSAFEAKNRLGRLLDRVEAGEELTITRHGEPVARLVPVEKPASKAEAALAVFRKVRGELAASGKKISMKEIIAWKNEGRR